MALELSAAALRASQKREVLPQLVLQLEGVDTIYGATRVLKYIRVGDAGLLIGGNAPNISPPTPWRIGGLEGVADSQTLLSMDGSGSTISQQLYRDKGSVSSIPSIKLKLVDKGNQISELISPGVVVDDVLGRRAKLYFGFQGTGFPEDFVEIFRGIVDEIESGPGDVTLNLAHPDTKKRQQIFVKQTMNLTSDMTDLSTSVPITDADDAFLSRMNGPNGALDTTISFYVRIGDEIIKYETANGTGLHTITRGQLDTVAAAHTTGDEVTSFYVIESDLIDLALKLMISGTNGYYVDDLEATSFNILDGSGTSVQNSIYFEDTDVEKEYNLQIGDYVTVTLSGVSGNNQVLLPVLQITSWLNGSYIVVGASPDFADEASSTAIISLRSQYDSWGIGLGLDPRDVDIAEHWRWQDLVLSQYSYRIYIKDTVDGKDFLEKEIYTPYGAYSIPRKGQASVGFHMGPVPTLDIAFLDESNIVNPQKIRLKRTISRNFYNTIVYQFDQDSLEDKFLGGLIYDDEDSKNRIKVGTKAFILASSGIRSDLDAIANTELVSQRLLLRYKFAAEYFDAVEVFFKTGFNLDPGDLVVLDSTGLQITNTKDGTRNKPTRFFEVQNKSLDLKTGKVSLSLLDTNFNTSERYGLISPSSTVVSGDTTYAILEDSFGAIFPGAEYKKWEKYVGLPVLVHDEDFTFAEEVKFIGFDPANPYKMLFSPSTPLSGAPAAGYIIDLPYYSTSADPDTNRFYKLLHAHFGPLVSVASGASTTEFDVGGGDVSKFFVGAPVIVHSEDFSDESPEVEVLSIVGTTITVSASLGFTPGATHYVSLLGFADEQPCYRWI